MTEADYNFMDLVSFVDGYGDRVYTRNDWTKRRFVPPPIELSRTPLVTVRKTSWKSALREWEWFMSGSNNINDLHEAVRSWWKPWADDHGRIQFNYSEQFRKRINYPCEDGEGNTIYFDQIAHLIDGLTNHPHSRRHVITTWNPEEMASKDCPITNCHNTVTQCNVDSKGVLSMFTYQRSCDLICGLPHNWIQQWAFLLWLAHRSGKQVGTLTWQGGDVHLYETHAGMVRKILDAVHGGYFHEEVELIYTPTSEEFKADDFSLKGEYKPGITDKVEMVI
jgi:thymidylate synthase